MRTTRTVVMLLAAPLLVATSMAPAQADGDRYRDPSDAGSSLTDIRRVAVRHTEHALLVRIRFEDLRRLNGSSIAVYVDSRPRRRGPERAMFGGLSDGSDWQVVRMRRWREQRIMHHCHSRLRLEPADDVAHVRIADDCYGDRPRVRAAVRMQDSAADGVVDWLHGWRDFTQRLAAG